MLISIETLIQVLISLLNDHNIHVSVYVYTCITNSYNNITQ